VQEGLQKLATQLQLTDDQKAKIKPLLQEQYTQLKSVHDDTSLSDEQKKAKMKAIHQDYHSQIQAVLTPEQQKKYAAMKEQKMKEMDQK
jgi:periplasmic protein CpxP/Spy